MRRNDRLRKLVSMLVVLAFICTAFISATSIAYGASFTGYSVFEAGKTFAYPLYVHDNGRNVVAYCFNADRMYPLTNKSNGNAMSAKIENATKAEFDALSDKYVPNKKDNVLKTVYYGYPYNKGRIKEKYSLSDMQFRAVTQAVIWFWTDGEPLEKTANSYGAKYNLTYITEPDLTTVKVYNWTSAMDSAYYELRNNTDFTYPSNFELDLYKCTQSVNGLPVQNLLSTKLTEDERPQNPDVEISKVKLGGQNIAGASIQIINNKDKVVHEYVSTNKVESVSLDPGTYTFHEKAAPNGYEAVSDFNFTVNSNGEVTVNAVQSNVARIENGVLVVTDQYSDQAVEISKVDIGGRELPGASMEITGRTAAGETISPIRWTSTSTAKKVKLQPGTYTLTETSAPKGYEKAQPITFKVDIGSNGNAFVTVNNRNVGGKVTMVDKFNDQEIEVSKMDLGSKELPGASMEITGSTLDSNTIEPIRWTSTDKTKKIKLQPGIYLLTEKTAPNGYAKAKSIMFTVSIDKDGNAVVMAGNTNVNGKVRMIDEYGDLEFEISKTDIAGKELPGASMEVAGKATDGREIEPIRWVSTETAKKIKLPQGSYTLTEKTAPTGYDEAESIDFKVTVDEKGKPVVTVKDKEVNGKVTMVDKYSDQEVEVSKTDIAGKELPGAKLKITGKTTEGKDIDSIEWTSTDKTKKVKLQPGSYTLTETTSPKGYEVAEEISFTVSLDENGHSSVKVENKDVGGKLTLVDKYSDQEVEVSKTDIAGKELPGAKLKITGKTTEGKDIEPIEWISTDKTKKVNLQPGTYTLTETSSPKGYEVAESIDFTVSLDKDGKAVVEVESKDVSGKVTMVDKYSDQELAIRKTDIAGKELPGAKMELTGKTDAGKTIETIKWTSTDKTKEIKLQPGAYTLKETTAPKGYEVAEEISFTVSLNVDGNPVVKTGDKDFNGTITMVDKYSDQEVEVSKTDIASKELPGAKLKITGKTTEGKNIEPIEWTSTEETRKVKLQPGTYTLTETTSPKGYEVAEEISFTVGLDENGNSSVKVGNKDVDGKLTMVDKYSDQEVEISKTDIAGKELPGASMEVTGKTAEGKDIETIEWVSTEETKKIKVQPGSYTLTEKTAPEGYEIAESISFTVKIDNKGKAVIKADDKDLNGKVTMVDKYSKHTVRISKVNLSGKEIEGAHILVKDKDGKVVDKWISEADTTHEMTVQPGVYTFHEESAPKGYKAVTDIEFSVDLKGRVSVLKSNGNTVKVDAETGDLIVTDQYDEKDKTADTGDDSNILLSLILMTSALMGIGGALAYRKS